MIHLLLFQLLAGQGPGRPGGRPAVVPPARTHSLQRFCGFGATGPGGCGQTVANTQINLIDASILLISIFHQCCFGIDLAHLLR